MKKIFTLLALFLSLVANAQVTRTVVYDFSKPTELNPPIQPVDPVALEMRLVDGMVFTNGDVRLKFDCDKDCDGTRIDADTQDNFKHYLRMYSGSYAMFDASPNILTKIEIKGTLSGFKLDSGIGIYQEYLSSEYSSIWSGDPANPTANVTFSSRSALPSFVHQIRVTYSIKQDVLTPDFNPFPVSKEYTSLKNFALDFSKFKENDKLYTSVKAVEGKTAKVSSPLLAEDINISIAASEVNPKQAVLTLAEEINEPGQYTITIPEGAIASQDGAYYNPELTYTVTLVPAKNTLTLASTDPAYATTIDQLPNGFKLIFSDHVGGFVSKQLSVFKLVGDKQQLETYATLQLDNTNQNAVKVLFARDFPISDAGIYELSVPEATVYNAGFIASASDYGVSSGARYNPEFTLKFYVKVTPGECPNCDDCDEYCTCAEEKCDRCGCPKPNPLKEELEAMKEDMAHFVASFTGVGYPTAGSSARTALDELIAKETPKGTDDITADIENLKSAKAAFYASTEIEKPASGNTYIIYNVAKDGSKTYLSYANGTVGLTADAEQAHVFTAHAQEDGSTVFETVDGKFLHTLVSTNKYGSTSTTNVTDAISEVNKLTVGKFANASVDAEKSFGWVTLYGYLGELSGEKVYAHSTIYTPTKAVEMGSADVLFTDDLSSAFVVEYKPAPIDPVLRKYELSVQPGQVDLLTSLVVTFPEMTGQEMTYNKEKEIRMERVVGGYTIPLTVSKVEGKGNAFQISFGEYRYSGAYNLIIPEGAFTCDEYYNAEIVAGYNMARSTDFNYDYFASGDNFIMLINDKTDKECVIADMNNIVFTNQAWNHKYIIEKEFTWDELMIYRSTEYPWAATNAVPQDVQDELKAKALPDLRKMAIDYAEKTYGGSAVIDGDVLPEIVAKFDHNSNPEKCTVEVKAKIKVILTPRDYKFMVLDETKVVTLNDYNNQDKEVMRGHLEPVTMYISTAGNTMFMSQDQVLFDEGVLSMCSGARFVPNGVLSTDNIVADPRYGTVFQFHFAPETFGDENYAEYLKNPSNDKKPSCHVNGDYNIDRTLRAYPEKLPTSDSKPMLPDDKSIQFANVTKTSFVATWNAATDKETAADALVYKLYVTAKVDGTISTSTYQVVGKTSYEITGLEEGTTYSVRLAVFDSANQSADYTSAQVTTASKATPQLPADAELMFADVTTNSVVVSWNAATDEDSAAETLLYTLTVTGADGTKKEFSGAGMTSATVTELAEGATYSFSLKVTDETGNSTVYPAASVTTKTSMVPVLPADAQIAINGISKNSAEISWNAATDEDSKSLLYVLTLTTTDGTKIEKATYETTYLVDGLTEDTRYDVALRVEDETHAVSYPSTSFTTLSVETYDLIIAGIEVTEDNKDNVTYDNRVAFDSATRVLSLKGTSLKVTGDGAGLVVKSPITIELTGKNKLIVENSENAIDLFADMIITGDGSLEVVSAKGTGIAYHGDVSLTIENTNVTVNGAVYGIGAADTKGELIVKNSSVIVEGAEAAIIGIASSPVSEENNSAFLNQVGFSERFGGVFDPATFDYAKKVEIATLETVGLKHIAENDQESASYNLAGQRVAKGYKGLVIKNGRKQVQK